MIFFIPDKTQKELKEHAAVDTDNGFILSIYLTSSSQNDSIHLPMVTISRMHTKNKIQKIYADEEVTPAPQIAGSWP